MGQNHHFRPKPPKIDFFGQNRSKSLILTMNRDCRSFKKSWWHNFRQMLLKSDIFSNFHPKPTFFIILPKSRNFRQFWPKIDFFDNFDPKLTFPTFSPKNDIFNHFDPISTLKTVLFRIRHFRRVWTQNKHFRKKSQSPKIDIFEQNRLFRPKWIKIIQNRHFRSKSPKMDFLDQN